MKVTFLTVMPSPYVQDLFGALAAHPEIELTVWYMEQEAPDTYWGSQPMPDYAEVLPGKWYGIGNSRIHWNPGIRKRIRSSDADLFVIVGYIGLTNQVAMRALSKEHRTWVFWGEVPGLHNRGRVGTYIRKLLQSPLASASGIAGVGSFAVSAYRELVGKADHLIVFRSIPYHCQLNSFETHGLTRESSSALRFLYCGQLIERKGVDLLCRSFARLVADGIQATLTLVGEGPMRSALQESLPTSVRSSINFKGFQPVVALPEIFSQHDVFVLPSRHDGWGVVVNQALAAGLPVIATTEVGAARDLVVNNANGFLINADDEDELFRALVKAVENRFRLLEMTSAARESARSVSLEEGSAAWAQLFRDVIAQRDTVSGA